MNDKFKKIIIGLMTGLLNGFFGSGGGIVLVPAMQKYLNVETQKSHASALAVICPLSFLSMLIYLKNDIPDLKICLFLSLGGLLGSLIGANLLKKISSRSLHKIFGFFMIVAALRMIIK